MYNKQGEKNLQLLYYSFDKTLFSAVKRDGLDQKVNVQWHDLILLKSYKLFRQIGLFLALVLGLGGPEAKF